MHSITFANPEYFWLLLLIIPMIVWYVKKRQNTIPTLQLSSTQGLSKANKSLKYRLRHLPFILRVAVLILLIIAVARPQSSNRWKNVSSEGIDIVLSMDISSSMLAEDFSPNRIEAAKNVATDFISGRESDRIGLVVFSAESFTQCPLTTDHGVLINMLKSTKSGMLEDGTAIGDGLATAVNRLKESTAKSKVIILLTDGVNNTGTVAPLTAAEIARMFHIRVYTIGVGTRGNAPYPVPAPDGSVQMQNMPVEIDEQLLSQISQMTDGKYFRATNNRKLKEIYQSIDKLEKSKIDVKELNKKYDEYMWFAILAGILLLSEIVLRETTFRSIP